MELSLRRKRYLDASSAKVSPELEKIFHDRLNFFRKFFHFSPPYHFLVDDTFVCSAIANEKSNIKEYLTKAFSGKCKLLLTSCVLKELDKLFPENLNIKRLIEQDMIIYDCHHSPHSRNASECLVLLAKRNRFKRSPGAPRKKRHVLINGEDPRFIIASQHDDLLKGFRGIPGVPVVFFKDGKVALDRVSGLNKNWAKGVTLKKIENMAIQLEILSHGAVVEADASHNAPNKTADVAVEKNGESEDKKEVDEDNGESKAKKEDECKPKSGAGLNNKSSNKNKRKRELSPDICEIPLPSSAFSKYKKLLQSVKQPLGCSYTSPYIISEVERSSSRTKCREKEESLFHGNSMQLTATGLSSSEEE